MFSVRQISHWDCMRLWDVPEFHLCPGRNCGTDAHISPQYERGLARFSLSIRVRRQVKGPFVGC